MMDHNTIVLHQVLVQGTSKKERKKEKKKSSQNTRTSRRHSEIIHMGANREA